MNSNNSKNGNQWNPTTTLSIFDAGNSRVRVRDIRQKTGTAKMSSTCEVKVSGKMDCNLKCEFNGTITGDLTNASGTAHIEGSYNGSIAGSFKGTMTGVLKGLVSGEVDLNAEGSYIEGTLSKYQYNGGSIIQNSIIFEIGEFDIENGIKVNTLDIFPSRDNVEQAFVQKNVQNMDLTERVQLFFKMCPFDAPENTVLLVNKGKFYTLLLPLDSKLDNQYIKKHHSVPYYMRYDFIVTSQSYSNGTRYTMCMLPTAKKSGEGITGFTNPDVLAVFTKTGSIVQNVVKVPNYFEVIAPYVIKDNGRGSRISFREFSVYIHEPGVISRRQLFRAVANRQEQDISAGSQMPFLPDNVNIVVRLVDGPKGIDMAKFDSHLYEEIKKLREKSGMDSGEILDNWGSLKIDYVLVHQSQLVAEVDPRNAGLFPSYRLVGKIDYRNSLKRELPCADVRAATEEKPTENRLVREEAVDPPKKEDRELNYVRPQNRDCKVAAGNNNYRHDDFYRGGYRRYSQIRYMRDNRWDNKNTDPRRRTRSRSRSDSPVFRPSK